MDRIKEELSEDPVTLSWSSEIADWASRTIPETHGEWQICHSFAIPVNDIPQHSTMLQLIINFDFRYNSTLDNTRGEPIMLPSTD